MGYNNDYENEPLQGLDDIKEKGEQLGRDALNYAERQGINHLRNSLNTFSSEVNAQATANASQTAPVSGTSASGTAQAPTTGANTGATAGATATASGTATATGEAAATAATAGEVASAGATVAEGAAAGGASTTSAAAAGSAGGPVVAAIAGFAAKMIQASKQKNIDVEEGKDGIGPIMGLILALILVVGIIISTMFGPLFIMAAKIYEGYVATVEFIQGIPAYFEEQKKIDFFEDLFQTKEVNGIIYSERPSDAETVEVYKDIIDYSIYLALKDYSWDLFSLTGSWNLIKEGYSPTITYSRLMKQPYPYALAKDDGTYYTVAAFLKDYEKGLKEGMDKREIINNDLNYAELFAILMQSSKFSLDTFTYSDFYDVLINADTTSLLIELEIGDRVYVKKEGFVSYDDETTLSEEAIDDMALGYDEEEEEPEEPSWWQTMWGGYDVILYPAGLRELYGIVDSSLYDYNKNVNGKSNDELLDYNELWVRRTLKNNDLGPSYEEPRSTKSYVYSLIYNARNGEFIPSGRSAYAYVDDSITAYLSGIDYAQLYADDVIDLNVTYIPDGSSYVMDMYRYISQLSYDKSIKRGKWDGIGEDPRYSIYSHGCIDCCYVMVYEYFYRNQLNVPEICRDYVHDDSFYWGDFMKDYGITNHYEGFPYERSSIQKVLTEGRLAIMKFHGYWSYNGVVYKKTTETDHYLVIMGYDDNGFYVYDPANERATKYGPIPYAAFYAAKTKVVYLFDVPDGCDVHYLINSPADAEDGNGE